MTRTYGTITHRDGQWALTAQPHVMIRVKRIFPRVQKTSTGEVLIADTAEVARDLEWLTERWALDMDDLTAARLRRQADRHRETEAAVQSILDGSRRGLHTTTPARPPRDYQQQAADLVHATGRLLIGDWVGLGKTMSALLVLADPQSLPALVVTPTHLPPQWLDELHKTWPWLRGHIATKAKPYDLARQCGGHEPDVLILGYSKLDGWSDHLAGQVRTVIFDEIQELRRSTSNKYMAARRVADQAAYKVGASATPVYNYGDETHNIMTVLAPDALGTRDEFIREWGAGEHGMQRNVAVADPAALGTYLRDQGLLLVRTRKDVHRELPEPIQIEQPVDTDHDTIDRLTGDAVDMARLIMSSDATNTQRWRASGDLDWKMRHATGVAKAPYVAEFVRLLLESERQLVLFGWHRACYDIWMERLADFNPALYTGTESPAAKKRNADAFLAGDSRVLIMSLRSGAGLDGLQRRTSLAVFGELDWSPGIHHQCVGRLSRDGQEGTVVAYYMVSDDGADPLMADVLQIKRQQSEPIMDPNAALFERAQADPDRVKRLAAEVLRRTAPRENQAS